MTQIKLRRDTAANFTSKNPVLGVGEPAYETDTKKLKIGDGTTTYTQLEYFSTGGGGSAPENMVTTDTAQTITGSKTFRGTIAIAKVESQLGSVISYSPVDQSIALGNTSHNLRLSGLNVVNKNNEKFLTQSNITGTDNITVTETADGVQVAGLSNAAIANLSGMTNNITTYSNVVSGTEYTRTEPGFWVAQGETTALGYLTIDMKDKQGNWVSIAGVNSPAPKYYLISATSLIAAGETIRVRHGSIGTVYLYFIKPKGGV